MSSFAPSALPTLAPTSLQLTPSSLVLGSMGVGTFAVLVLAVAVAVVFALSAPCDMRRQLAWRIVSSLLFVVVFLALLFAPRESPYESTETLTENYDESFAARIAVAVVLLFSSLVAAAMLLSHCDERIDLSTTAHDPQAFWHED